jgi:Flp pilus assembly protein TadD
LTALLNLGRFAQADDRARTLLDRYPNAGFVWKVLGLSLMMRGMDARPALKRAAELSPADAEAHGNFGKALQDHGQLAEAVASYRRTLEIEPELSTVHSNMGIALRDLGQLDRE